MSNYFENIDLIFQISYANKFNLLGLQMNDNLKWNTHIDHVLKNVSYNRLTQSNITDIPTINVALHL